MQYLTCFFFSKQTGKKQNSRGFTSLFFFVFVFFVFFFLKKKLLLHWLDFPSGQKKHSYNLLQSMAIDCSRPFAWASRAPRAKRERGSPAEKKRLCSPKSTFFFFFKCFLEKNRRGIHLMVKKKIHNPKLPKC